MKFYPSARLRWSRCPGSAKKEASYPFSPKTESGIDGDFTHKILAEVITSGLGKEFFIGTKARDETNKFRFVDEARWDRIQVALDYINEIPSPKRVFVEEKVKYELMSGRIDILIVRKDKVVEIIDFKDGMGVVDVENNEQLEAYALMCLESFPDFVDSREIKLTIIQPKIPGQKIKSVTFTNPVEDLKVIKDKIDSEITKALLKDAPLVPGEIQCRYCKHAGKCEALTRKTEEVIGTSDPMTTARLDPQTISNEKLSELLENAPLIRQFLISVEEESLSRLKSGQQIPGFKLVRGNGSRKWTYSDEEMEAKLIRMGVPKKSLYVTSFVSPAQLEKLKWEKAGKSQSITPQKKELIQSEYVTRTEGKLIVAAISDHREEVITNFENLFE